MSSKGSNPYADSEFLRSAMVQKEHTEREFDVVVTTAISVRRSPCVLLVRLEATSSRAAEADHQIAAYQYEWPNTHVVSWTASLFQAFVKLGALVEDVRRGLGVQGESLLR